MFYRPRPIPEWFIYSHREGNVSIFKSTEGKEFRQLVSPADRVAEEESELSLA